MKRFLFWGMVVMCLMLASQSYAYLQSVGGGALWSTNKCTNTPDPIAMSDTQHNGTGSKFTFPTTAGGSGFNIWAIGMSVDNTIDSGTFVLTNGPTETTKISVNMKSGRPDFWAFPAPIVCSGTVTITASDGADVLIMYVDY